MEVDLDDKGIDLLDYFRGTLSLRKLLTHVHLLGKDSLVCQEMRFRDHGEAALWDVNNYELADIKDLLSVTNYWLAVWVQMNSQNGKQVPPPKPAYRPGMTKEEIDSSAYQYADHDEIMSFFGSLT